jgi:hypothetical protein
MENTNFKIVDGQQLPLTEKEILELNERSANIDTLRSLFDTAEQAKLDLKASVQAKLSALGLTSDEILAITG